VRIARGDGLRWWSVGFSALSVGSVPTLSPHACWWWRFFSSLSNEGCPVFLPSVAFPFVFARLSPLVELQAAWTWTVALASVIAGVCRSCCFSCSPPPARPAAGSFRCYRLYDGLVVMLVTGSMAILVLGVPWRNCAGQLGFFFFRGRWELLGEMGCGGGPWVLALLSTEALIFYYKEKNSNRDLEEGRDRRRLKLLTLTGNFLWFS